MQFTLYIIKEKAIVIVKLVFSSWLSISLISFQVDVVDVNEKNMII